MKNPTKLIVIFSIVCTIVSICFVPAALAQNMMVKAQASASQPHVGDPLTIDINLSGAQDIFGVDVTLDWNPAVLQLMSAIPQLGVESHSGGVLHESSTYPIEILDNSSSQSDGEYHLLATSTGSSTPGFSGSGTITTVTFSVKSLGDTGLALENVELSQLASDRTTSLVDPLTSVDKVIPQASGVSVSPSVPAASITPTPSVPELTQTMIILLIAAITIASVLISTKRTKGKTKSDFGKKSNNQVLQRLLRIM
jgi:Cohesin domain